MKKFVPMAEYQRMTGLSYPTVKNALETGQLKGIKTEAGHWRIDLKAENNTDTAAITERLDSIECLLKDFASHFGLAAKGR